mmetsp:Transcript_38208/g.93904  ORF Transcript_38208/g.93904 Transcript_38208/m.93904 type:complete len:429 (-) Transcript_38208:171-1457(-)
MVDAGDVGVSLEDLKKMKVVELQAKLRELGESAKGAKADLIERLAQARSKQGAAAAAPATDVKVTMKPLPAKAGAPEPSPKDSVDSGEKAAPPASGEVKEKTRVISVRGSGDGGSTPAAASEGGAVPPQAKKMKAESGGAVTSDSIQALVDELGVGAEEEAVEPVGGKRERSRMSGRLDNSALARPMGSRMRSDGGPGSDPAGKSKGGANTNQAVRADGVRGRGANRFAAVAEESKREEPPQQRPEKILKLEGLRRPFTDKQLKEHMGDFGQIKWFWLNRIKSVCFVEYPSEEEASHARTEIYDVQWPSNSGGRVKASFCTKEEADAFVEKEPSAKSLGARLGAFPPGPAPLRMEMEEGAGDAPPKRPRWNERQAERGEGREPKRLEDLFNKTKAKPEIFWVPNKPEVVSARLERMRAGGRPPPPPPH